ncbi:MAG: hypothetical protein LBU79_08155 [Planctomycetota bacterium]|jgi:hypothetical protein|nr:hypothetical protein [Planctomycetota bacterium]
MLPDVNTAGLGFSNPSTSIANESVSHNEPVSRTEKPQKEHSETEVVSRKDNDAAKSSRTVSDQVELRYTLSTEESEAFSRYFANRDESGKSALPSPEDQEVIQKAAERISHALDGVINKNLQSQERLDRAISQWYSDIASGSVERPTHLIGLLGQLAMGKFDSE